MKAVKPNMELQSIALDIHRGLAQKVAERDKKVLHASDITNPDFCAREVALMRELNRAPGKEVIPASLNMTFKLGYAVQDIITESLGDKAIGDWRCNACNYVHERQSRPIVCKNKACNCENMTYEEVRVYDKESGISSGIDLLALRPNGKLRIIECKSMKDERWRDLLAPLQDHVLRTQLYMEMCRRNEHPFFRRINTKRAEIVYISKTGYGSKNPKAPIWKIPNDGQFSPVKAFWVQANPEAVSEYIELGAKLESKLPAKSFDRVCAAINCNRAKKCQVVDKCFSK